MEAVCFAKIVKTGNNQRESHFNSG